MFYTCSCFPRFVTRLTGIAFGCLEEIRRIGGINGEIENNTFSWRFFGVSWKLWRKNGTV